LTATRRAGFPTRHYTSPHWQGQSTPIPSRHSKHLPGTKSLRHRLRAGRISHKTNIPFNMLGADLQLFKPTLKIMFHLNKLLDGVKR
jgi:hypothetical protein